MSLVFSPRTGAVAVEPRGHHTAIVVPSAQRIEGGPECGCPGVLAVGEAGLGVLSKTCQTPAHAGDSQICAWLEATQVCSPPWSPGHVAELPIERSAAYPRDVHPGHAFEVFRGGRSRFK